MRNIRIGKDTSNNKKTGLYIRVSTNVQFEEGYSVGAQTEKLEKYCNYQEIDNYDLYIDGGYSYSPHADFASAVLCFQKRNLLTCGIFYSSSFTDRRYSCLMA